MAGKNQPSTPNLNTGSGRLISDEDRNFWGNFSTEMRRVSRAYPWMFNLTRRDKGEWVLASNGIPQHVISHVKQLCHGAAQRLGFTGTVELGFQYWCDHINGDHMQAPKVMPVDREDVDMLVESNRNGGEITEYRGHQKVAGSVNFSSDARQRFGEFRHRIAKSKHKVVIN